MNKEQAGEWTRIVEQQHLRANAEIDLLIILDATLSMKDAIEQIKTKLEAEFVHEMYSRYYPLFSHCRAWVNMF